MRIIQQLKLIGLVFLYDIGYQAGIMNPNKITIEFNELFLKTIIDLGLSSDMVNIVNEYFESVDGDL